ncbi:MAG: HIT family protein [Gemmatimonadaceae bacterium]|nr:HIT family protein [Gemmatimonadaceae bacterium]
MTDDTTHTCIFCRIMAGEADASIVAQNAHAVAFMDVRQAHPGHVLVVSRSHINDLREANAATLVDVFTLVQQLTRAVGDTFPNDGMSLWHSIGAGGNQEVPHLHVHIHPRVMGDRLLEIYPEPPTLPAREDLDAWAEKLIAALSRSTDAQTAHDATADH